jgi:hypothetical protein
MVRLPLRASRAPSESGASAIAAIAPRYRRLTVTGGVPRADNRDFHAVSTPPHTSVGRANSSPWTGPGSRVANPVASPGSTRFGRTIPAVARCRASMARIAYARTRYNARRSTSAWSAEMTGASIARSMSNQRKEALVVATTGAQHERAHLILRYGSRCP